MSVHKKKGRSGKITWYFQFSRPGATRKDRKRVFGHGFGTKGEAIAAEATRRLEVQRESELANAGSPAGIPKTMAMLLDEFFRQHVDEKLAPKTRERYHEQATYLDPNLLSMALAEITPLHLEPGMGTTTEVWWPNPENESAEADERQDGPQHRRRGIVRIRSRNQVGLGDHKSGDE